jgi:rhamnulokinase
MRCYRDPRNNDGVDVVHQAIAWPELYKATGIQFMPINTVYQLAVEDPVRLGPGATFLPAPDYLGFLLTGHVGADVTHASTGALVDVRTRQWSRPVLDALGLPIDAFPPLQEPGTIRGRMELPSGAQLTHISVGGHDTASAFAAIPTTDANGSLFLSMGTWALIGLEGRGLVPTDAAREANVTHELGVDGTVRMLRNVSGMWLFEECRKWWAKEDGYAPEVPELLEAAWAAPAFAGFVDVDDPDLASPGQSPERIAAHITGTWDGSRGGLVRILFESMVITITRRATEIEKLEGGHRNTLHVVGGPTRITPLMQWLADATNKEVIAGPVEATALGNAAVQWKALGVVSDLAEARARISRLPDVKRFVPSGNSKDWLRS